MWAVWPFASFLVAGSRDCGGASASGIAADVALCATASTALVATIDSMRMTTRPIRLIVMKILSGAHHGIKKELNAIILALSYPTLPRSWVAS